MMTVSMSIKLAAQTVNGLKHTAVMLIPAAGLKYVAPPASFGAIDFPERRKLKVMERQPVYHNTVRPPKMTKKLELMRGPEEFHTYLINKQYGIQALGGGRLKYGHFEMTRFIIGRKLNLNTMFAQWRVDAPWLPVTKKGQGQRMGGGKGAIDHYATPLRAGRIVLEIAGHCTFEEVKPWLQQIATNMPFKARAVSHEMLVREKEEEEIREKSNSNLYTPEYLIRNNMGGCPNWISPVDRRWFWKHA